MPCVLDRDTYARWKKYHRRHGLPMDGYELSEHVSPHRNAKKPLPPTAPGTEEKVKKKRIRSHPRYHMIGEQRPDVLDLTDQ